MPLTADIITRLESEIPGFNHWPLGLADFHRRAEASTMAALAVIPTAVLARDLREGARAHSLAEKHALPKYVVE